MFNTVPANIPIVDDKIDEANEQNFIAYMEVVDAVNFDLIRSDARNISTCTIVDDDCKALAYKVERVTL